MTRDDSDRLLSQVLAGQDWENFRQSSLEQGLGAMRQRRRRRRAVQIGVLACLLMLGTMAAVFFTAERSPDRRTALPTRPVDTVSPQGIKMITDEELFALFPNRPLALVGKPGHQQLVFLDEAVPAQTSFSQ